VIDLKKVRRTGFTAWVLWTLAHIYDLIGFRNRLGVFVDWLWSYLTYQRGARLIPEERPMAPEDPPRALAA
jgi:NADH:ubiquinone reductase (H+-translocating)